MSLLKIPYEDIIAKANKRKEKLQKMEELAEGLPDLIMDMQRVADELEEFYSVYYALDQEGRNLLPKTLQQFADCGRSRADNLRNAIYAVGTTGQAWGAKAILDELAGHANG